MDTSIAEKYPKPATTFAYGTAGFRTKGSVLESTVFRTAVLAALRSKYLNSQTIGIMVTASHNPPEDNGVKVVDPQGDMLEQSWEAYVTELANAETVEQLASICEQLIKKLNIDDTKPAKIVYARDTRESGPALVAALEAGIAASPSTSGSNAGILTTPQLHYIVRCVNTQGTAASYGDPTEEGYYKKLSKAFKTTLHDLQKPIRVTIDGANGVGAPKVEKLAKDYLSSELDLVLVNGDSDKPELLNSHCGADFVKTTQAAPAGIVLEPNQLYASFDGDADRIVFYYANKEGFFVLLDGDKIATLAAAFFKELAEQAGVELNIGVVQTAYANGSSTKYLENQLKVPVVCTPTGVKHLHHVAQTFDIGVYFEANGHGTVLFDEAAVARIREISPTSPASKEALDTLIAMSELINQTVGDAISDLLMVLVILNIKSWTPEEWNTAYTDLPNRLAKAKVADRTMFTTTDAERKLVTPEGLQAQIDALVQKYPNARSFVRASGTENVVRIYAEANTVVDVDDLLSKVSALLERY